MSGISAKNVRDIVHDTVQATPIFDIHTHLYPPGFGSLNLWGIDELLTYHYLIAEVFRVAPQGYDRFFAMSKPQQADYVWQHLFVERSPISEACRGVLTVLHELGIDLGKRDLGAIRNYFSSISAEEYADRVFKLANIRGVVMTNDPFDKVERGLWESEPTTDARFATALRIDPLLNDWDCASAQLADWGYKVRGDLGASDIDAVKKFLSDWIERIAPRYLAVSLPPSFALSEGCPRTTLIEKCVLPVAQQANIPFAMMIGVRRGVNPKLQLAADAVGKADVTVVERLCREFPDNKFMVTMLSRENQHELCVTARKLPNLLVFGCWWFLNNPSIIDEITRQRLELLGLSFVPQHSDARVLDQLIYKWAHSRLVIADVLADKYADLLRTGWPLTEDQIKRDVADLFGGVFERFAS